MRGKGALATAPAAPVVALRRASSYGAAGGEVVEAIETHLSWVFLTGRRAYKLKKPIRTATVDYRDVEARRRACSNELRLNRRLSPGVYLGVVPVVAAGSGVRVGGDGPAIDWLLEMRRLPRQRMLDARIAAGDVELRESEAIAALLVSFYRGAEAAPFEPATYLGRLAADLAAKCRSLAQPCYQLPERDIAAVLAAQRRWIERHRELLGQRGARVVDAHGDLRPEHICLAADGAAPPAIIDCLEFDRSLRLLDPVSELSFLALECRRLGAAWIGEAVLAAYAGRSGDAAPAPLIRFYQSRHAVVRAAVAVWHLDDAALDHSERWRRRGACYLRIAGKLLGITG